VKKEFYKKHGIMISRKNKKKKIVIFLIFADNDLGGFFNETSE